MSDLQLLPSRPHTSQVTTLDDLWREAETLGCIDIRTDECFKDGSPEGYTVRLYCRVRGNRVTIRREHRSLACAIADAITEARHMGAGELA